MSNPLNHDLESGWYNRRPEPPKQRQEPAESYVEADERQRRIDAIYGKQDPLPRPRTRKTR